MRSRNRSISESLRRFPTSMACAAAMAALVPASQANLLVNGSFESPNLNGGWAWFWNIPGWSAIPNSSSAVNPIEIGAAGIYGNSGADGSQVLELDAWANSAVSQTVATVPGGTYLLSLKYASRIFSSTADNLINVYWDGSLLTTLAPTSTEFADFSAWVSSSGATTALTLEGAGIQNGWGSMVDGVELEGCEPPEIGTITPSTSVLWPPNHKLVLVNLDYEVTEGCGGSECTVSATSNEPDNGLGDGDTAGDIQTVPGNPHQIYLRAERSGKGSGRVYTVQVQCTDEAGNTTIRTTTVAVPHRR